MAVIKNCRLLYALLFFSCFSLFSFSATAAQVETDGDCLNLRDSRMEVDTCIPNETPVEIIGRHHSKSKYLKVKVNGKIGYMWAQHINKNTPTETSKKPLADLSLDEEDPSLPPKINSKFGPTNDSATSNSGEHSEVTSPKTAEQPSSDKIVTEAKIPKRSCNSSKHRKTGKTHHRDMLRFPRYTCGSAVYRPSKNDTDAYIHPITACAFTAALQAWRSPKNCPKRRAGCTIQRGDISHISRSDFNGVHFTHTDGFCIDLRPLQKKWTGKGTTIHRRNYDSALNIKFLRHMKKFGSDTVYFNDRKAIRAGLAKHMPHHHHHIHICIKPGRKSREVCRNFKPDFQLCPETTGMMKYIRSRDDLLSGKTNRNKRRCLRGY